MFIQEIHLKDIKCFQDIYLTFQSASQTNDQQSNWNVILGENGDGKTTLLQSIAACLMDATTAQRLLVPDNWVHQGKKFASMRLTLVKQTDDKQSGAPRKQERSQRISTQIIADAEAEISLTTGNTPQFVATATLLEPSPEYRELFGKDYDILIEDVDFLKRNAFSRRGRRGWFSCGYGAFRRISGFSSQTALVDDQIQKRFLTLFEEGAALYDCENWLKELDRKATKSQKSSPQRQLLTQVLEIIQELLPEIDQVKVEDEVQFLWQNKPVSLAQLSDGYRSMFALTVDILRWLVELRPPDVKRVQDMTGVVLIDEIDAHLHPKWQREAGFLFTKIFPGIQFIVTSHSPFVAMAAGEGALTLLEKTGTSVTANQDIPYVRGWAVDQVLTQVFGMVSQRDPETTKKLARYQDLRFQQYHHQLHENDIAELHELKKYLNMRLSGDPLSPKYQERDADLAYFQSIQIPAS